MSTAKSFSASFEYLRDKHLPEIEKRITAFLDKKNANAEMSAYQLSTGGKRIRALLPIFVYEFFGANPTAAYPIGLATEILHNATLVHDDIQDGDEMRRNMPTVWKKYSEAQAINCGDALFQYTTELLLQSGFSSEIRLQLIELAAAKTLEVIEGQSQEFLMKDEAFPKVERYLEVVRGKTSGLFSFPVAAALISLIKTPDFISKVSAAMGEIGLLFQINDDLLDLYGDKGRGNRGCDILEGKISALVAVANTVAAKKDREELRLILKKPRNQTTEADLDKTVEIFERYRAKKACEELKQSIESRITSLLLGDQEAADLISGIRALF